MDTRPIGFFDSGLGGLSVLKSTLALLPREDYIYFGDNLNAPYGDKSIQEITRLTLEGADLLISYGVKAIVLACNTATGSCINQIRERLSLPVISVEPAIKPACESPEEGQVLMLATAATVRLPRYRALVSRMPDPARVISIPCPGLVDRIEQGLFNPSDYEDILERHLKQCHGLAVSGIVLGCTHYPFIGDIIQAYAQRHFSGSCTLYDGSEGTARQLERVLMKKGLDNGNGRGEVTFLTSGDRDRCLPLYETFMKKQLIL